MAESGYIAGRPFPRLMSRSYRGPGGGGLWLLSLL